MAKPLGYSRQQIWLHWGIAVLILFQIVFGESMAEAWDAFTETGATQMTLLVWGHIIAGVAVLLFALWRLYLRAARGVPAPIAGQPRLQVVAGEAVHWIFYAIMIGAPLTGMAAWYGGVLQAGEVHGTVKPVIVALVAVHVLAALYHQVIKKDGLLLRMWRAQG